MKAKWALFCCMFSIACFISAEPIMLRLATLNNPPYIEKDGDDAKGEIGLVVKAIMDKLNIKYKIEFFPAARGVQMVMDGDRDVFLP